MARFFYIQVIWGADLQKKAVDQWTRNIPVLANRGDIVDRNGVVLATCKETYTVFVRPRAVKDVDNVSKVLADIFSLDSLKIKEKITTTKVSEIKVKKHAEKSDIVKLEKYNLEGVYYAEDVTRYYPYNELLCQTLGYTSQDGNGISGLELYYDKYLSGINGEILYEADLTGSDLENGNPYYLPATDGLNLMLTIDYEIQEIVEALTDKAMSEYTPKSASILVMDCNNGEILAMSQKPSFNLNEVPYNDIDTLNKLGRIGMISDSYEPGSTFKTLTASANIEEFNNGNEKAFSLTHVFSSNRYRYVGGKKIKCWSTHENGKHANENLSMALNNSCNPIFVDIALSLGKETFYKYVNSVGYGKCTGIDLNGEAQGMVIPYSSATEGDLARISFGQSIACTPLQLAVATSAVCNGGYKVTPHLVKEMYTKSNEITVKTQFSKEKTIISSNTSKIMCEYLEKVVSEGSGKQAYIENYRVAGKTGTAQKFSNGVINVGKYVMSFIGFFPANNPKYLALVIVDEPVGGTYGSTVSAPICKEVFSGIIQSKNIGVESL